MTIKLVKSLIGCTKPQIATAQALGSKNFSPRRGYRSISKEVRTYEVT